MNTGVTSDRTLANFERYVRHMLEDGSALHQLLDRYLLPESTLVLAVYHLRPGPGYEAYPCSRENFHYIIGRKHCLSKELMDLLSAKNLPDRTVLFVLVLRSRKLVCDVVQFHDPNEVVYDDPYNSDEVM